MKRILAIAAVAALPFTLPAAARASSWEIDPSHSTAQFSVKHLMVSNVRGEFTKMSGTLELDEKDITRSSVQATIDAASIDTRDEKRDAHLKSADFFDTAKHPTLTFKSKKVERAGKGKLKVTGDLTLRGTTREVVLSVEGPTAGVKDPWGNVKAGASATTKINRKDYGLAWNAALETGGVVVGDEVAITLDLELTKKPDPEVAAKK